MQIRTKVLVGTPFLEIIREVLRSRHDLVVKAAEGGRRALLFGNTDLHLLRKCPCPVWIDNPGHHARYARILAAVDPDPFDERRNVLNLFVLIGNPFIVMVIMGVMGYRKRTGFLAGLTVAQISEFSLLFGTLGVRLGHIDTPILGLITLVGLVTIGLSTYMILYSAPLYEWLAPLLKPFERRIPAREPAAAGPAASVPEADVILFGLGRYGSHLAHELRQRGWPVLGVDFDPMAVELWRKAGLPAYYGDAEDPDFPAALPLGQARWVVSAIPQPEVNLALRHGIAQHDYAGRTAVTAHDTRTAERLRQAGFDVVLLPFKDAAREAASVLAAAGGDQAG